MRLNGMVDVSGKNITLRRAKAQAVVKLKPRIIELIKKKKVLKGDVLEQAKVAGIMAAKKTSELIPLCHPLSISDIKVSFALGRREVKITSSVNARERTGVEMEALIAATLAALTIYDMCKMYDRAIEITEIFLLKKTGGKSKIATLKGSHCSCRACSAMPSKLGHYIDVVRGF